MKKFLFPALHCALQSDRDGYKKYNSSGACSFGGGGKAAGEVRAETDSHKAAQNIWLLATGIGTMLAANIDYKYQDGLDTLLYGAGGSLGLYENFVNRPLAKAFEG